MPPIRTVDNYGVIEFKRTPEEVSLIELTEENKELKETIKALQESVEEIKQIMQGGTS